MRIGKEGCFHLTYCTKIHQAKDWRALARDIRTHVPALKSRLAPERPFGIGLRLGAAESHELLQPARLRSFRTFLARADCYVFTMNGFPFGSFAGQPVKAQIFAPDWQEEERVRYTLRLVAILRRLLPAGLEGSISTLPLSYKPWIAPDQAGPAMERIVRNLLCIVEALIDIRKQDGPLIHLDIEPEPDGLVENNREFAAFYRDWLLAYGAPLLAKKLQVDGATAARRLREHIQLCLDTCHLAVSYEKPTEVLSLLAKEGIAVGKVQIASGLKLLFAEAGHDRADLALCLERFADSAYLHQVIGREPGPAGRFPDLCGALPRLAGCRDEEWRIHYHMPLFVERYGMVQATQAETREVLQLLKEEAFTRHLEIETYTWEQLPADLKIDLRESLWREYRWVLTELGEEGERRASVPELI